MADNAIPLTSPPDAVLAPPAVINADLSSDPFITALPIIVGLIGIVFAYLRLRQQRILALEGNLAVQQHLNELALASSENLKAAFMSVRDDGEYDEEGAREVFFHYLRLNRIYRAWILWQNWVLRREDYHQIVECYAGTLKKAAPLFDHLRHRGYPPKFIAELKRIVDRAETPPLIDLKKISQSRPTTS